MNVVRKSPFGSSETISDVKISVDSMRIDDLTMLHFCRFVQRFVHILPKILVD